MIRKNVHVYQNEKIRQRRDRKMLYTWNELLSQKMNHERLRILRMKMQLVNNKSGIVI